MSAIYTAIHNDMPWLRSCACGRAVPAPCSVMGRAAALAAGRYTAQQHSESTKTDI